MKLQHRSGLFVNGNSDIEYYLEYTKTPFKLVCKHLKNYPEIDITALWNMMLVDSNIKSGSWIEFSLDSVDLQDTKRTAPKIMSNDKVPEYKHGDTLRTDGEFYAYSKKTPRDIWELVEVLERHLKYLSGCSNISLTRNQFYSIDKMNETIANFKGK